MQESDPSLFGVNFQFSAPSPTRRDLSNASEPSSSTRKGMQCFTATGIRMHYTPEHCLPCKWWCPVILVFKKPHVSTGWAKWRSFKEPCANLWNLVRFFVSSHANDTTHKRLTELGFRSSDKTLGGTSGCQTRFKGHPLVRFAGCLDKYPNVLLTNHMDNWPL